MLEQIQEALNELANPEKAKQKTRFFKAEKGGYAENDIFIGVSNPEVQQVAKHFFKDIEFDEIQKLIENPIHEYRFTALTILVYQYKKCKLLECKTKIIDFYISHTQYIDNWDLVDCSAYFILGDYIWETQKFEILHNLIHSAHLWSERIAIVSTLHLIRQKHYDTTFALVEKLKNHKHDLIHKAMGWMLREVWTKGGKVQVEEYLNENAINLPRTTLRYAIEKMDSFEKHYYMGLSKNVV